MCRSNLNMIFSEVVGVIILYITYFLLEFCAIIYIDFFKKIYEGTSPWGIRILSYFILEVNWIDAIVNLPIQINDIIIHLFVAVPLKFYKTRIVPLPLSFPSISFYFFSVFFLLSPVFFPLLSSPLCSAGWGPRRQRRDARPHPLPSLSTHSWEDGDTARPGCSEVAPTRVVHRPGAVVRVRCRGRLRAQLLALPLPRSPRWARCVHRRHRRSLRRERGGRGRRGERERKTEQSLIYGSHSF